MDLDAGVAFAITRQKICQQILDDLRCGANPQHSDLSSLERAGALAERLGIKQQPPAAHQQVLALRRQPHVPSDPREQPQTQFILERPDLPRRRRLGQIQPRGRARKTGIVGDRDERAQEPEVHRKTFQFIII
ncbi:MAG TPA: hypothetical protein VN831_00750 [Bradyrhizobium sp.]|nr:hypothetical protein [Bradyrhizobium sp.]